MIVKKTGEKTYAHAIGPMSVKAIVVEVSGEISGKYSLMILALIP